MLMYDDLTFCCSSHWTADLHREIGGRFKGEKKKKKKRRRSPRVDTVERGARRKDGDLTESLMIRAARKICVKINV